VGQPQEAPVEAPVGASARGGGVGGPWGAHEARWAGAGSRRGSAPNRSGGSSPLMWTLEDAIQTPRYQGKWRIRAVSHGLI